MSNKTLHVELYSTLSRQHIISISHSKIHKVCGSLIHKPQSFGGFRSFAKAEYLIKYSNGVQLPYCSVCLERAIGWFRAEMVKVELRREN